MEYTCGCKTSIDPQRASLGYKIDYCPKHSACEDMYEALNNLLVDIARTGYTKVAHVVAAQQALSKAEGKEV